MSERVTFDDQARAAGPCMTCMAVSVLIVLAVAASFAYLAIDLRALLSAQSLRLMAKFIAEFFPPDLSAGFVTKVGWGALQTLAVSALGTLLAALAGALIALPALNTESCPRAAFLRLGRHAARGNRR